MVGTLVVTLPSSFTGGELVGAHNEERQAYDLDHGNADSFGKMAGRYGQSWTAEQVRTWFAGKPGWTYAGGPERPRWIADQLPGLCARLQASGPGGAVAARQLVELAWEWTAKDIAAAKRNRDETDLDWLAARWSPDA